MSYVKITDTRIMQEEPSETKIVVKEGAQNVAYIPLVSASLSANNVNFNLNNIASNVCRSRRLAMRLGTPTAPLTFTVNVTGTTTNQNIFQSLGFKSWPLNRAFSSIQEQINQASYTVNPNLYIDSISKCNTCPENFDFWENTQPDQITNYNAANGSGLDPLQQYAGSPAGWGIYKPRSNNLVLSNNVIAAANTPQNVTVQIYLYEPLMSPFGSIGKKEEKSLYAINGNIIQGTFVTDIWNNIMASSVVPGITINSVSVAFPQTATLEILYLTPSIEYASKLPHQSVSHYNNYSTFSFDLGAVNAGAQLTNVTSPVCQLTNVPFKILVYARQSDATRTIGTPDRYLAITNINSCQFDNGSSQLSSISMDQAWEMSHRNGLQMDRAVWKQQVLNPVLTANGAASIFGAGSILVLDPKIDLGLRADISDGSPGRYIFQIVLNFQNKTADNWTGCTFFVVAVTNAVLERVGSEYRNYLLSLEPNAIHDAKDLDDIAIGEYNEALDDNGFLNGGSFKSHFSKIWKAAPSVLKFVAKNRDKIISGLNTASNLANKLGYKHDISGVLSNAQKASDLAAAHGYGVPQNMGQSFSMGRNPQRRMDLFYQ